MKPRTGADVRHEGRLAIEYTTESPEWLLEIVQKYVSLGESDFVAKYYGKEIIDSRKTKVFCEHGVTLDDFLKKQWRKTTFYGAERLSSNELNSVVASDNFYWTARKGLKKLFYDFLQGLGSIHKKGYVYRKVVEGYLIVSENQERVRGKIACLDRAYLPETVDFNEKRKLNLMQLMQFIPHILLTKKIPIESGGYQKEKLENIKHILPELYNLLKDIQDDKLKLHLRFVSIPSFGIPRGGPIFFKDMSERMQLEPTLMKAVDALGFYSPWKKYVPSSIHSQLLEYKTELPSELFRAIRNKASHRMEMPESFFQNQYVNFEPGRRSVEPFFSFHFPALLIDAYVIAKAKASIRTSAFFEEYF
ncbi:hypothetical protein CASFOL_019546 [Castilleja foliolosa]|uniref:KEN domain-containing protein n=1 Tax=Castilleja foliolosa TaxID=1961234 RepID=A0ABD3D922_9LAMI